MSISTMLRQPSTTIMTNSGADPNAAMRGQVSPMGMAHRQQVKALEL